MSSGLAAMAIAAAVVFIAVLLRDGGRWRQRGQAAERLLDAERRAHEIQNDVAFDPAYRERVRRRFDRP